MNPSKPSSPPCLQGEKHPDIDPAYLGLELPSALVEALQNLLMAERAGAAVARESMQQTLPAPVRALLKEVLHHEAESCRLLHTLLKGFGIQPTMEIGAFHAKAMALNSIEDRIRLIDRGRQWVQNKLEALLESPENALAATTLRQVLAHHTAPVVIDPASEANRPT